jgi:hypothetical protein
MGSAMWDWIRFWEFTQADWAGLTFLALLGAAGLAFWQVSEAKRLREAQARPFVVVDFVVERGSEIYIVVSNIGETMARDVGLTFDPELTSSLDSHPNITPPRELKPLRERIPSLPPGKQIPMLFDIFHERDAAIHPDLYRVTIRLHAPALNRDVTDDAELDLGVYRSVLHATRRDLHDVHERLKARHASGGDGLKEAIRAWASRELTLVEYRELPRTT